MPPMGDSTRMWISAVPSLGPDSEAVILDLDQTSSDPAERLACVLLNRGHEGEEGVFYLLPEDLSARYERNGDRLSVALLAYRSLLAGDVNSGTDGLGEHIADLPPDPLDSERVVLLRRELRTDYVPAEWNGARQPVLLIDHAGAPAVLTELFDRIEQGEAGIAVLAATAVE